MAKYKYHYDNKYKLGDILDYKGEFCTIVDIEQITKLYTLETPNGLKTLLNLHWADRNVKKVNKKTVRLLYGDKEKC